MAADFAVRSATTWGHATEWLLVGFVASLGIFGILIAFGVTGGEGYWDQPLLSVPFTLAVLSVVGSGATAVVDSVRERRVTVLGIAAMLLGTLVAAFMLAEVVAPH